MPSFFCLLGTAVAVTLVAATGCFRRTSQEANTPRELEVVTSDGVRLASTMYPVAGPKLPAIIFVPMLGSDRRSWQALAIRVQQLGFMGLAIDLRGRGDSTHQGEDTLDYRHSSGASWHEALLDVAAAKKLLLAKGADPANIAVVGAGIGASLALRYSANDPDIAAVALLSPSLDDHGFHAADDIAAYGLRPVLLVCGEDDTSASGACAILKQRAPGFCELRSYAGSARGTDLLAVSPNALEQIAQWFVPILKSSKSATAAP